MSCRCVKMSRTTNTRSPQSWQIISEYFFFSLHFLNLLLWFTVYFQVYFIVWDQKAFITFSVTSVEVFQVLVWVVSSRGIRIGTTTRVTTGGHPTDVSRRANSCCKYGLSNEKSAARTTAKSQHRLEQPQSESTGAGNWDTWNWHRNLYSLYNQI